WRPPASPSRRRSPAAWCPSWSGISSRPSRRGRSCPGPGGSSARAGNVQRVDFGRYGAWRRASEWTPDDAAAIEEMGYGAIWVGGSPPADLEDVEAIIAATRARSEEHTSELQS